MEKQPIDIFWKNWVITLIKDMMANDDTINYIISCNIKHNDSLWKVVEIGEHLQGPNGPLGLEFKAGH